MSMISRHDMRRVSTVVLPLAFQKIFALLLPNHSIRGILDIYEMFIHTDQQNQTFL